MAQKSLPAIIQEAEALTNALIDGDGEITPELDSMLAMNGRELRDKLDSYGYVIDALKMRQTYALQRMKDWEKVTSQAEKALDNLKARIIFALGELEIPEIHGYEYTFRLQANPPSVIIDSEQMIPGEFITTETKTITKIDKRAILDAIKTGREIPGARSERSTRLVSKVSQRKELEPKKAVERL